MLRKLLGTLLIILGLASAGLGVASATVWRDPDTVVATAVPQGDGTLVVTDPGVLELIGPDVTVRATVAGDFPVVLAIGRDIDVDAWVGVDHSTRVTGLTDWETLTTRAVEPEIPEPAEGQEAPVPGTGANPWDNDMWVAQAHGDGTATLRWDDRPGRWSLIAASVGEDATAPTLELTWPREVTTEWLWRGVIAGGALVLAGLAVLLIRGRKRPKDASAADVEPRNPEGTEASEPAEPGRNASAVDAPWSPTLRFTEPAAPADGSGAAQDGAGQDGSAPDGAAQDVLAPDAPLQGDTARPGRAPLLSRRSRRAAAVAAPAAEPAVDAVPDATPGAATDAADRTALATDTGPAAQPARRSPFAPVFGSRQATPADPASNPAPEPAPSPWASTARRTMPAPATQPGPGGTQHEQAQHEQAGTERSDAEQSEPLTSTGSLPLLTRRELRAQEEARKAAENPGIAGRIRALTGSIPVVRPATGTTPVVPSPADGQQVPSRRTRSAAWRQTWGFDPDAPGNGSDAPGSTNDPEGGTR